MKKLSIVLRLGGILLLLSACGQEYWQRQFAEDVLGEWRIDKVVYLASGQERTGVGRIVFTQETHPEDPNPTPIEERGMVLPYAYYEANGQNNRVLFVYQPQGYRQNNQITFFDSYFQSDALGILDVTYKVLHISANRMELQTLGNTVAISLSR